MGNPETDVPQYAGPWSYITAESRDRATTLPDFHAFIWRKRYGSTKQGVYLHYVGRMEG